MHWDLTAGGPDGRAWQTCPSPGPRGQSIGCAACLGQRGCSCWGALAVGTASLQEPHLCFHGSPVRWAPCFPTGEKDEAEGLSSCWSWGLSWGRPEPSPVSARSDNPLQTRLRCPALPQSLEDGLLPPLRTWSRSGPSYGRRPGPSRPAVQQPLRCHL